ncbi:hypothetical protein [Luteococcus peritonei]|uniref:Uncharacterized protein n=1 Tax=Luteococcus peritonei TaxID=88874 RepID=A0ABW4RUG9_9ACTN
MASTPTRRGAPMTLITLAGVLALCACGGMTPPMPEPTPDPDALVAVTSQGNQGAVREVLVRQSGEASWRLECGGRGELAWSIGVERGTIDGQGGEMTCPGTTVGRTSSWLRGTR